MSEDPKMAEAVRRVPLLSKLHPSEAEALCQVLKLKKARRGCTVVREGDTARSLYFVVEGKLKVCHIDRQGKEVILAILSPGEHFGEIALLAETPRTNDVVGLTDCCFLILEQQDFLEHAKSYRGLNLLLLHTLALRLRATSLKLTDQAQLDVGSRLARVLLGMSEIGEYDGEQVNLVRERLTHQELAAMVGTSREVVTRTLRALQEEGHLLVDHEMVVIKSLPQS